MDQSTQRTAADLAFAEFRRTGNAAALATAFDATANELLRVAAFLVPRDEIEDLVHDTYTVALSRQARYDAGRPLLPWLLGVLANEARHRRRQSRMLLHESLAAAPASARDPAAVACDRETAAAFTGALAALDRDDRELLRLHLLQDLSCREIAERLRRPAGTVRTQVARAMSELRRRLPVGLGMVPLFGGNDPVLLPALRRRVLAAAAGPAPWLGSLLSGRGLVLIASVVVLVLAVFASRWSGAGAAPPIVWRTASAPAVSSAVAGGEPTPLRQEAAATVADARVAAPLPVPQWRLRGIVRDASGAPIVAAIVRCRLDESGPVLDDTATDAAGVYQLDLSYWRTRSALDRDSYGFVAVAEAPGRSRLSYTGAFPPTAAESAPLELSHDFLLQSYPTLCGRVLARDGSPVPAKVLAFAAGSEDLLDTIRAGTDGRFRIIAPQGTRRVRLDVRHASGTCCGAEFDLQAGREVAAGDLVLDPGTGLRGRVTLLDGTAVAGFEVDVSAQPHEVDGLPQVGPDYWFFTTTTDVEGRFAGSRPVRKPWRVWVPRVLDADNRFEAGPVPVEAGADSFDMVLDGVLLRCKWTDPEGRELLPQAMRMLVFAADRGAEAIAAQNGDRDAAHRAMAELALWRQPYVVPPGSHLWLQAKARGGCGIDQLVQVPARAQPFDLTLQFRRVASTELTVSVRFDDGAIPDAFTCRVLAEAGASARDSEEIEQQPGRWRGRCAVGPVRVLVSGYESWRDGAEQAQTMTTQAGADNHLEVVLARRGRVQLLLRDLSMPRRVVDETTGDVMLGPAKANRFFWEQDGNKTYWGSAPIGQPVEAFVLLPIGRHEARITLLGYEPAVVTLDVRTGEPSPTVVWLQPK